MKHEPNNTLGTAPLRGVSLPAEHVALLRSSFAVLAPVADELTSRFYARLFDLDPALKPMFQQDMVDQGRKFMTMLLVMVRGLDQLDRLLADVQNLGRRHVAYGVAEANYETLREALLWAMQQQLGDQWTPDLAEAWTSAYSLLANNMIEAAREVPVDPANITRPSA